MIGDILTSATFDEGELAREKGVILQEYAAIEDTPDDVVYDAFTEAAFPGQPVGRPIIGRPETIKSFDGAGIRAYLAREYTPDRIVVAGSGSVDHDAIAAAAEQHFGGLPAAEAPTMQPGHYGGGERRMKRKLEQANLVIGLPGLSFRDEGYYALHMFAQVLGGGLTSRLWHEVRETRGLAYEIQAFHWPFSDCGLFGIGAGTAGSDVAELVKVTLDSTARAARDLDDIEVRPGQGAAQGLRSSPPWRPPAAGSSATPARSSPGPGDPRLGGDRQGRRGERRGRAHRRRDDARRPADRGRHRADHRAAVDRQDRGGIAGLARRILPPPCGEGPGWGWRRRHRRARSGTTPYPSPQGGGEWPSRPPST